MVDAFSKMDRTTPAVFRLVQVSFGAQWPIMTSGYLIRDFELTDSLFLSSIRNSDLFHLVFRQGSFQTKLHFDCFYCTYFIDLHVYRMYPDHNHCQVVCKVESTLLYTLH